MNVTQIPETLPPAITISREMTEFSLSDDLERYGTTGPVALTWQWVLTGKGPTPIALQEWDQGPPSHDMLRDESRWPYGDGWGGRVPSAEVMRARFLLWWVTADPEEEVPSRFLSYDTGPDTAHVGPRSVTMTGVYGDQGAFMPLR